MCVKYLAGAGLIILGLPTLCVSVSSSVWLISAELEPLSRYVGHHWSGPVSMSCSLRMVDPPSLMLIAFSTPSLPAFVSLLSAVLGGTFDQPLMEMKETEKT